MIILRALLNGTAALAALFIVAGGVGHMLWWIDTIDAISFPISFGLGAVAAAAVLFLMSRLQRNARHLSVPNLIVQNILSVAFIVACLLTIFI
jgi:hypothetical protein